MTVEKLDRFITYLSYNRKIVKQLIKYRNLKYLHLIFKGFLPDKGYYFDFKKYGYHAFVTDRDRYLNTTFINYHNRDLMDDKYGCNLLLDRYTDKAVTVLGVIEQGNFYSVMRGQSSETIFLPGSKFIIKPRRGRAGEGVMLLEVEENAFVLNKKDFKNLGEAFKGLRSCIVNPYVSQHEYAAKIFPHSLNTIRLVTCVLNDEIQVIRAAHRFGASRTGVVDNFDQGGIIGIIEPISGEIQEPLMWDDKQCKKISADVHPDTLQRIKGVKIPRWNAMLSEMLELHASMKYIKYVGWDIAITPESFVIIEANYATGTLALQLQSPLLLNDHTKKFFELNRLIA